MAAPLRIFVAWPLPDAIRRELGRIAAPLRTQFPAASWPRPESLHLTFAFLGETAPESVAAISSALDACAGSSAIEVRAVGIGVFPNERRPRVAWVGIEPAEPIVELASRIRAGLSSAGAAFDEKPFRPHLTLARIKAPWGSREVARLRNAFDAWASPAVLLDRIVLYESHLSPAGAVHAELHGIALRER